MAKRFWICCSDNIDCQQCILKIRQAFFMPKHYFYSIIILLYLNIFVILTGITNWMDWKYYSKNERAYCLYIFIQIYITRHFYVKNYENLVCFYFTFNKTNARYERSINLKKYRINYTLRICKSKSTNRKKYENFVSLNRINDRHGRSIASKIQ